MNKRPNTMKGLNSTLLTKGLALGLIVSQSMGSWAMEPIPGSPGYVPPPPPPAGSMKAAGCSPASQITQLNFNNVRAVIENGGNMWTRRGGTARSGYEVPKTEDFSGPNALYAGSLWMGGVDPSGQLKIAAVLYRTNGNDFWPGPLTNTGDASVTPDVCQEYDAFYETSRMQAEAHVAYFNCSNDPDCDPEELFPNGYSVPTAFMNWPAIGNVAAGQDLYLAPFVDAGDEPDGFYDPLSGDYPDYGFDLTVEDCINKQRETPVPLFGDNNIYWIFNDKGNAHTETQGQPIGLEVRAQAFSFNSNDEVNNMTFYNYVVINQGSQTLTNTYFGQFADPDLGCSNDDFAGCDVQRGLGYVYNWDPTDEACLGAPGYGGPNPPPPAVGIDFFEGPFQDADNIDNPGPNQGLSCQEYQAQGGIPYKGLGIGYGDVTVDNERFGMRAYIYFNREGNTNLTDPSAAPHFYNYLRSIWKNGVEQTYGGTGYSEDPNAVRAYYMFPGDSDPLGWGTNCVPQPPWSESEQGNLVDRRFIQSAGPFTLEPGAYNNVTVGVVWARAASGDNYTSVNVLRIADDKAQALFDNCFKILEGPDAPDIEITELDRELILHLIPGGNNVGESYVEVDPIIPETDTSGAAYDREYRFQGYLVYQLSDATVSVADLADPNRARLIYQGDVEDGIGQIINYNFDQTLGLSVPTEMVNGADEGIQHSIRVTQDAFAQGTPQLINFKTYYFLALSYGYNNYEDFDNAAGTGQAFPFVAGRAAATGAIRAYAGIPHKPAPQSGGTIQTAQFGDMLPVTRLEGHGNGGNVLELQQSSVNAIMDGSPWREDMITYVGGRSPIQVKVIDPLAVPDAQFEVWLNDDSPDNLDEATWNIKKLADATSGEETISSDRSIDYSYEQLILKWGLSVTIDQTFVTGNSVFEFAPPIGSGVIEFADPSRAWFTGIPDAEGEQPQNWIRAGAYVSEEQSNYNDKFGKDNEQLYEDVLGGTWAPWALAGWAPFQPSNTQQSTLSQSTQTLGSASLISQTPSVQFVITSDKSKWTRSVVLEQEENDQLSEGGAEKLEMRAAPSVDKEGRSVGESGVNEGEATLNGTQPTGAGWFPGYAIDAETGERLNIAFGENSFWGGERGRDMLWNPDTTLYTATGSPYFGGSHWIYVFKNQRRIEENADRVGVYDESQYIYDKLTSGAVGDLRNVFRSVAWVGSAMVASGRTFMSTDVKILLSVEKPYATYTAWPGMSGDAPNTDRNNGLPFYSFSTSGFATQENVQEVAESSLDIINVVPNPYYAFSGYETSRLDNRIKFINLPQTCTISIFNVGGALVRKFKKDNDLTYLDWDLRNMYNVPIAGGAYICHIEVPGVGEKVVKWFGVMRPIDLQNF